MNILPASDGYAWPSLALDPNKIVALTESLMGEVVYGLGAKIHPLSTMDPGDVGAVDCSGFVRWALFHALGQPEDFDFPDGSVQQHEWVGLKGFKETVFEAGELDDGAVRIAFLDPRDTSEHIGHVMLITGGKTCESHGGVGPDRRDWGSVGWMRRCSVYVLTPPKV